MTRRTPGIIVAAVEREGASAVGDRRRARRVAAEFVDDDDRALLSPTRRSSGFTEPSPPPRLQKWRREPQPPPSASDDQNLYLSPAWNWRWSFADLAVLGERWRVAAAGAPGRIVAVQPVEDVEDLEVGRELVAPRRLEGLRDAQVEPLVGNVLLRARAGRRSCRSSRRRPAGRSPVPRSDDIAERRSRVERQQCPKG